MHDLNDFNNDVLNKYKTTSCTNIDKCYDESDLFILLLNTWIDKFLNGYEKIMNDYGHCNKDNDKLDDFVKAHYRRFFVRFDIIKHGKCVKFFLT